MKKLLMALSLIVVTLILVGCRHDSEILERVSKEEQEKFIEDYIKKDTNEDLLAANFDCKVGLNFYFNSTDKFFEIDATFYMDSSINVYIRKHPDFTQHFNYQEGYYKESNITQIQNGNSFYDVVEFVQRVEISRKEFVEQFIRDFCMFKIKLENGNLYEISNKSVIQGKWYFFKYKKSYLYERNFFDETIKIKFKEVTISPTFESMYIEGKSDSGKKSNMKYSLIYIK